MQLRQYASHFLTGYPIRGESTMNPCFRFSTAILLIAVAGPSLANAQTLMDYVVSRERFRDDACAAPPAAGCAAPVTYSQTWQPPAGCEIPAAPAYNTGWQTSAARAIPATPAYGYGWQPSAACAVPEAPVCAAPAACHPAHGDGGYAAAADCAVPSTPSRTIHTPRGCRPGCHCGREGCHCRHGSEECEEDSKCRCCCCSGWRRAHTTGDLYPHFPYPPEHGGYYYFRPYNWETVHEHVAYATQWGVHTGNPYSVSMFDAITEEFEQRFSRDVIDIPEPPRRRGEQLPDLEQLVRPLP